MGPTRHYCAMQRIVGGRKDEGPMLVQGMLLVEKFGQLLRTISRTQPAPELKMLASGDCGGGILLKEPEVLNDLENALRTLHIKKLSHNGNLSRTPFGDFPAHGKPVVRWRLTPK
jgi:hypothetical protein